MTDDEIKIAAKAITLDQQIACLRREIAMRKNVYPKWIENKRMKQTQADHELAAMQACHDTIQAVVDFRAGKN